MPGSTPQPAKRELADLLELAASSANSSSPSFLVPHWLNGSVGCWFESDVEASRWWTPALSAASSVNRLYLTGRKLHRMSASCCLAQGHDGVDVRRVDLRGGERRSSPRRAETAWAFAAS